MKEIKYICITAIFAFLLTSCKKDFLEGKPYSFTTVENFYKTAADAELGLTGCYNVLNAGSAQGQDIGIFQRQMPYMVEGSTDENINRDGFSSPIYTPLGLASWTSQTEYIQQVYLGLFVGVNRCNTLLAKMGDIEMDASRKKEIIGEATFLRGLYYYYAGMLFGGVPIFTSIPQDGTQARQTLKEVFTQVIADFDLAYQNLPNRARTFPGRANKWSAAGFLAKTYAYLGSSKLNGNGAGLNFALNSFDWVDATDMYTKAKGLTTAIIASSGYILTPKYDYLFRENNANKFKYDECLFVVESAAAAIGNQNIYIDAFIPFGNRDLVGGGTGRLTPLGELYRKYNAADFRRDWNITGNMLTTAVLENVEGDNYYVPTKAILTKAIYNAKFRYRDPKIKAPLFPTANSDGNYPVLRYADILLIHAEAIYYTTNDATLARTFLSQVRKRALIAPATTTTVLDAAYKKTDFIDELLDERSRELCMETQRHFDLARFGRYTVAINALSGDKNVGWFNTAVPLLQANWKPYRIWFPIPLTELSLNRNLVQNPGY
jgi:hypothetical protein